MSKIDELKLVFSKYNKEVMSWLSENELSELKNYSDFQRKDIIGKSYREDQHYFEKVSSFKTKVFSTKSYLLDLMNDNLDRIESRKAEQLLKSLDEKIKMLESLLSTSRYRIKFYESIIYLISNMTYGDF